MTSIIHAFQLNSKFIYTWWLIPLSKWVTTLDIHGISGVSPLITGVIAHLLRGMNHQVDTSIVPVSSAWSTPQRAHRMDVEPPVTWRIRRRSVASRQSTRRCNRPRLR